LMGDIIAKTDGKTLEFTTDRSAPQTNTAPATEGEFIGNKKSKVFHLPSCGSLPAEQNRTFFTSRNDAINAGFKPCSNCKA